MRLAILALIALPVAGGSANGAESEKATTEERFRLDNGLQVIVRPIRGASGIACVVLYRIGGDHDPEGRSGLAHMVEHLYVTAAAGQEPSRSAEAFFRRYAAGANAQTGDRYTVVATVFPKDDLDKELRETAARMGGLKLTAADLDREQPRLLAEVENMFGRIPTLGALNNARELVRPTPSGGRKGGQPDHVKAITLEELRARWQRFYKPRNAILVLAGAVESATVRKALTEHFGKLAPGEEAPRPHEPGKPQLGRNVALAVKAAVPGSGPEACLMYAAPEPGSTLYAPFLVLAARLFASAGKSGSSPGRFPIYYPLLEDPAVIGVCVPARPNESEAELVARLEAIVSNAIEPKLRDDERTTAQQTFGLFLGLVDIPDAFIARNPYTVALALGRREQLGVDPAKLKQALQAVTDQDLRRVGKEVFAPGRHAGAIVSARP